MRSCVQGARAVPGAIGLAVLLLTRPSLAGAQEAIDRATILEARIDSLRCEGRYEESVSVAEELLALRRQNPAAKPFEIRDAERLVPTLRHIAGLPEAARSELAEADRLEKEIEEDCGAGRHAAGEEKARRQLEVRGRHLGNEHPDVATSLNDLAVLLQNRGDYAGAEPLCREALAMYRKLLGGEHPDVASSLNHLAILLKARGDYAGAEPLCREALAMYRKLLGGEHPDVAASLLNLGSLLRARGDYAEAEQLHREALAMFRKLLGNEHPDVAASLNDLAGLLQNRGDYAGAEPLCREALAMRRKLLGNEHPDVAGSLNDLAVLLQNRGDYAGAEPLYREALAMYRKLLGSEHPYVAVSLNNLASLFQARGDYARAEPLHREALAMNRKLLGNEHRQVATSLDNLGLVLDARGDYAGAELLCREALAMRRKLLGNENTSVATSLNNLALLLQNQGDYSDAEPLCREALAMYRKLLGNDHPSVAGSMNNIASLLKARGDYDGAEPLFREALVLRRKLLGNEHPYVAVSLNGLGSLLHARGDYAGAEEMLAEACQVHDAARSRIPLGQGRSTFQGSPYPRLAATNLLLHHDDQAWPACEHALGRSLWELLQSTERRGLSAKEKAYEDSLRLALGDLERQLEIFRKGARKDSTAEAQQRIEGTRTRLLAAEAQWSAFQQEIAAKYPVTEGQAFELARVQAALQPDEAIVGWLDLKQEEGQPRLPSWGYVLRHQGPVAWHKLSEGGPAESGLHSTQAFRFEISQPFTAASPAPREARAIYDERLAPLMDDLKDVRHLIVIPSGDMLGIPIEALVTSDSGELLGDRFAVSYIPSATIHTWLRERAAEQEMAASTSCLAMGDPPFSPEQLAAMNAPTSPGPAAALHPDSTQGLTFLVPRGQQPALGDQEELLVRSALAGNREVLATLSRLPSTREEAQAVARLHGAGSRLLLGPEVSEPELVRMAQAGELKQFRTIHIATHALMDDERPENSALILSQVELPDPLEAAMSGERIYDGCLSAGEIVREWSVDADLVTVSACETGLGRKVAGEGYIGLAHAFLQAGARALLVSLWSVEDRSTSLLMERFYGNRLERGQTKVEALREAKRWLREWRDTDGRRPYAHPYFWAGFVLIGEAM